MLNDDQAKRNWDGISNWFGSGVGMGSKAQLQSPRQEKLWKVKKKPKLERIFCLNSLLNPT